MMKTGDRGSDPRIIPGAGNILNHYLNHFLLLIDPVLIGPYRLTEHALAGFVFGTLCLALWCVVIGELTLSAALRFNRRHIDELKREIADRESLSWQAHAAGDHEGYQAINKQANDAWGRHFFSMAAHSAGMLWPIPFALFWMDSRFHEVQFSLFWPLGLIIKQSVGYPFFFIPLYILARLIFGKLRRWLPYFRGVQKMLDESSRAV